MSDAGMATALARCYNTPLLMSSDYLENLESKIASTDLKGADLKAERVKYAEMCDHVAKVAKVNADIKTMMRSDEAKAKALVDDDVLAMMRYGSVRVIYNPTNGVAQVDIDGILWGKLDFWTWLFFGGVDLTELAEKVTLLLQAEQVTGILLNVDSPGGDVSGTEQAAQIIKDGTAIKPIVGVANEHAASGAFWILSAVGLGNIYLASSTSTVGSIGVYVIHKDMSQANFKRGQIITTVSAGDLKTATSSAGPLSDPGRGVLKQRVDAIHGIFIENSLTLNREMADEDKRKAVANGAVFMGQNAIDLGLADHLGSLAHAMTGLTDRYTQEVSLMPGLSAEAESDGTKVEGKTLPEDNKPTETPQGSSGTQAKTVPLTVDGLKAQYPDVYEAVYNAGHADGVKAENTRVLDIDSIAKAGHEDVIAEAKKDTTKTAGDVAVMILQKDKEQGVTPQSVANDANPAVTTQTDNQGAGSGDTTKTQTDADILGVMTNAMAKAGLSRKEG